MDNQGKLLCNRIHIFQRNGEWLCFVCKSNRLFQLTEEEASLLKHLIEDSTEFTLSECVSHYQILSDILDEEIRESNRLEPINTFYLRVNHKCNMHCGYCRAIPSIDMPVDNRVLSPETALATATAMQELGAKGVGIHGGNPLVTWPQTYKVLQTMRRVAPELSIGLTCNGTLLTDEIVDALGSLNVQVSVELDGSQAIHNQFKRYPDGTSSFHEALNGAKKLRERGILAAIESTVSGLDGYDKKGYQDLEAIFPSIPIVVARIKNQETSEYECHGKQLKKFLQQELDAIDEHHDVMNEAVAGLVNICSYPNLTVYRCNCFRDKVSVDLDGSVYICPKVQNTNSLIGNVMSKRFVEEFEENRYRAALRFSAKPIAPIWYSNMVEYCVDSVYEDTTGKLSLRDEDIMSEFYEDLLYLRSKREVSALWEQWIHSGF